MNLFKKITYYILIIRPFNVLITFFVVVVAAIISSSGILNWNIIICAALAVALTASAGNIINDIVDIEIDRIVHPNRPLVLNVISVREAFVLYFIFFISALTISFFIGLDLFGIMLIANALLVYYSYQLKKFPLIGNITVSLLTGLAFIYGGVSVNNTVGSVMPAVFAFLINFIRELVKDIQDKEGDAVKGLKTFPIVKGNSKSKQLIYLLTVILILSTLYPYIFSYYKIEYFIVVMILVNPLLVYSAVQLSKNDSQRNLLNISLMHKLNMIIGLLAIYLGK
jgi:geranylgeranylglycerol-phosphate geranylgeranyltransferase